VPVFNWRTESALAERHLETWLHQDFLQHDFSFFGSFILAVLVQGIQAGRRPWALRPDRNNNRMDVYRYRRLCRSFHTPRLHVCLSSTGGEITHPLKERL
jgi:hypothetical protein